MEWVLESFGMMFVQPFELNTFVSADTFVYKLSLHPVHDFLSLNEIETRENEIKKRQTNKFQI